VARSEAEERAARYADFEHARARSVVERLDHGLIHTFRPGFDDGPPMRSWTTRAEYRQWCEENLEPWLGYCSPEKAGQALAEIENVETETNCDLSKDAGPETPC
jgi:hypothetical protein